MAGGCGRGRTLSLLRQSRHYLAIGLVQWLLDWGVMVGLSHLGSPVEVANIAGRVCGASLGFWANGRFTFAGTSTAVGRHQLLRFVVMWLGTTVASTWALALVDDLLGLKWAWLAKPLVELALGALGFFLSRHWVYRK